MDVGDEGIDEGLELGKRPGNTWSGCGDALRVGVSEGCEVRVDGDGVKSVIDGFDATCLTWSGVGEKIVEDIVATGTCVGGEMCCSPAWMTKGGMIGFCGEGD
jgi:hypothetical protein